MQSVEVVLEHFSNLVIAQTSTELNKAKWPWDATHGSLYRAATDGGIECGLTYGTSRWAELTILLPQMLPTKARSHK